MDIKVERKERSRAGWLLAAVGVGALAILLGVPNRYGERPDAAGVYDPDRPAVVSYEGRRLTPADRSVVLDDAAVRSVGRTAEGFALFAPAGGGGGAAGPASQLYLKAGEDRYVPVFAR